MLITFASGISLDSFWLRGYDKLPEVLVFGVGGLGLVSYKKELDGETEFFHDVAKLSRETGGVVISGLDTDTYGVYKHSVVIAERGKILGVSDMCYTLDDSEYRAGGNFRVYETHVGKIGIIVGDDVYFTEPHKVLSLCDADIIFSITSKKENNMAEVITRALSFTNGVVTALIFGDVLTVAGTNGEVILSSRKEVITEEIKLNRDYRKITAKRRGITMGNF